LFDRIEGSGFKHKKWEDASMTEAMLIKLAKAVIEGDAWDAVTKAESLLKENAK
jgi:hypothetical protein